MNYILNWLKHLFVKPTDNVFHIPDYLTPYVRLFGSRKWGGYTQSSDIDLLAREVHLPLLLALLDTHHMPYSHSSKHYLPGSVITFFHANYKWQITVLDNRDYPHASRACDILDSYYTNNPPDPKAIRAANFEAIIGNLQGISIELRNHIKLHFPELLI